MEKLQYKLEVFEGPMDLLLQLIAKKKVSINDVPIMEIIEQYLDFVRQMQEDNLDISSEFLEMAARLLYIKTVSLLPVHEEAEKLVEGLGFHFRTVKLAAGDCSASMARTYDIEILIPSMDGYKEVSSVSNARDYQARRGNIRYRRAEDGKIDFVHTLNGSGVAVGRTVAAILENYQNADGSVTVPETGSIHDTYLRRTKGCTTVTGYSSNSTSNFLRRAEKLAVCTSVTVVPS